MFFCYFIQVFTFSYDDVYVTPSASPCIYADSFLFGECCACIFLFLPKLTSGSNHHLSYGGYVDVSATQTHLWLIVFLKEIQFVFTVVRFCFTNATHEKKVSGLLSNTKSMHCVFAVCLFLSSESFLGTASFQ